MSGVQKYVKGMPVAAGEVVEFSNGAHAEKQANGRFKIIKGPNAAGLAKLHASPRRSKKYSVKGAKNVMGRHYNKKSYKSPGRRMGAIKRDMCRQNKPEHVVEDSRWARNPSKYDLKGFDDGSLCDGKVQRYVRRAASPKQAAALARGRARRAANLAQRGGADGCGFRADTMRCAKGVETNEEWCQMGKKGRCVKSPAGRKSAPKRGASAKQLAGLAKGRASRARKVAEKHAAHEAHMASHPMAMMGCNDLPMDDCVKHPACNYVAATDKRKAHCKRSTKGEKRGKRN